MRILIFKVAIQAIIASMSMRGCFDSARILSFSWILSWGGGNSLNLPSQYSQALCKLFGNFPGHSPRVMMDWFPFCSRKRSGKTQTLCKHTHTVCSAIAQAEEVEMHYIAFHDHVVVIKRPAHYY